MEEISHIQGEVTLVLIKHLQDSEDSAGELYRSAASWMRCGMTDKSKKTQSMRLQS